MQLCSWCSRFFLQAKLNAFLYPFLLTLSSFSSSRDKGSSQSEAPYEFLNSTFHKYYEYAKKKWRRHSVCVCVSAADKNGIFILWWWEFVREAENEICGWIMLLNKSTAVAEKMLRFHQKIDLLACCENPLNRKKVVKWFNHDGIWLII